MLFSLFSLRKDSAYIFVVLANCSTSKKFSQPCLMILYPTAAHCDFAFPLSFPKLIFPIRHNSSIQYMKN